MTELPSLRELLESEGLWAKKSLGQHFLLDLNITRRIAKVAAGVSGDLVGKTVIEIGPGPGGLTRALLEAGAQVIAIEKDARFFPLLQPLIPWSEGRLTLVHADALEVDEEALLNSVPLVGEVSAKPTEGGRRAHIAVSPSRLHPDRPPPPSPAPPGPLVRFASVVSNLPYNVGTPLLVKWLKSGAWRGPMTLMFQKEVARRIAAKPGDDAYGRLAVLTQARCDARIAFTAPARAFTPPPKIESAVVLFTDRADPYPDLGTLEKITAAAFGQRRKMLRSALKALTPDAEALLCDAGIDPTARAEEIDQAGFRALADTWRSANR